MIYLLLVLYFIFTYFFNEYVQKKNLLKSNIVLNHQLFVNNSVPLSGGIILIFPFILILNFSSPVFVLACLSLFILGILSDLSILNKAKLRFFLQFVIVTIFVFFTELQVLPTRITFIDENLDSSILSLFFTIFCILILINGSNFIDGLNGLLIGYIISILIIIFKFDLYSELSQLNYFKEIKLIYCIIILIFLFILNLKNKLFLGDSGAYSLSFIIGVILIKVNNLNSNISPYFIILLLWYPCFENLFSIIRKYLSKKNPLQPDNFHLHHLLFIYFNKSLKLNRIISNNLSGITINIFNFIIFVIGSINMNLTILQLTLISFCILIYLLTFYSLRRLIQK